MDIDLTQPKSIESLANDDTVIEPSTVVATTTSPVNGKPSTTTKTPKKHHSHLQKRGNGTTSSHIHLWQFLKELLASPQTHGTAIRWLDRSAGIFKIEDSVRVARLWGRRKNRPAMNYVIRN